MLLAYDALYFTRLVMLLTSLDALKLTSLLLYNTLRKTSLMFVIRLHALQLRTKPVLNVIAITAVITAGAIYASIPDFVLDVTGSFLGLKANLTIASFLILACPVQDKLSENNIELVYFNTVTNIPTFLLVMLISGPSAHQFLHSIITDAIGPFSFLLSAFPQRSSTMQFISRQQLQILLLLTGNTALLPQLIFCSLRPSMILMLFNL